jgi:hypothetical protein
MANGAQFAPRMVRDRPSPPVVPSVIDVVLCFARIVVLLPVK